MFKTKDSKKELYTPRVPESENLKQLKDKIEKMSEELLDLLSKYKAKRNLWEIKLKADDDPRRHEFYAIIARLAVFDIIVTDLTHFSQLLLEISENI